jgi:hypothetical protein
MSEVKWINVKEKLPEEDEYVLTWDGNPADWEGNISHMRVARLVWMDNGIANFMQGGDPSHIITHWAELPEPPNE